MKIGFIGTGNMGSSIIKGILSSKFEKSENINIFDFELSCSEIKEIRKLNKKQPYFTMTYEEQEKNFLSWKLED